MLRRRVSSHFSVSTTTHKFHRCVSGSVLPLLPSARIISSCCHQSAWSPPPEDGSPSAFGFLHLTAVSVLFAMIGYSVATMFERVYEYQFSECGAIRNALINNQMAVIAASPKSDSVRDAMFLNGIIVVTYMDKKFSEGVMINKPISASSVRDADGSGSCHDESSCGMLLKAKDLPPVPGKPSSPLSLLLSEDLADNVIFCGGPVQLEEPPVVLHVCGEKSGGAHLGGGLFAVGIGNDRDVRSLRQALSGTGTKGPTCSARECLVVKGRSGWGRSQLHQEMHESRWVTVVGSNSNSSDSTGSKDAKKNTNSNAARNAILKINAAACISEDIAAESSMSTPSSLPLVVDDDSSADHASAAAGEQSQQLLVDGTQQESATTRTNNKIAAAPLTSTEFHARLKRSMRHAYVESQQRWMEKHQRFSDRSAQSATPQGGDDDGKKNPRGLGTSPGQEYFPTRFYGESSHAVSSAIFSDHLACISGEQPDGKHCLFQDMDQVNWLGRVTTKKKNL